MGAAGYSRRIAGLVSETLPGVAGSERRNQATHGKPRLVLDWSPSENDQDYDGSFAGTDVAISGLTTKINNREAADNSTSTTTLLRCTLNGLKVTHIGGSAKPTLFQWDLSALPGMNDTYKSVCVSSSFVVDALSNGSTNSANCGLFVAQALQDEPVNLNTNMDVTLQAIRISASNWRCRIQDWTGASSKAQHNMASQGLGSSEPAAFRLMLWGNSYQWRGAYDLNTGPATFQGITNDQRVMLNNSTTAHTGAGLAHPVIKWTLGRGEDTAITVTLTNLRVWTY